MSHSSSHPRKRQRMSSPTYDEQLALPGEDELKIIDQLELGLSQAPAHYRKGTSSVPLFSQDNVGPESPRNLDDLPHQPVPASSFRRRPSRVEHADLDDPFSSTSEAFTGFVSASSTHLQQKTGSFLPESDPGDHDDGVVGPTTPMIGFISASNVPNTSVGFASAGKYASATCHGSPSSQHSQHFGELTHTDGRFGLSEFGDNDTSLNPMLMFTSFGKKANRFQPSAAAVKEAEERAKRWDEEDDTLFVEPPDAPSDKQSGVEIPQRQALLSVENHSERSTVPSQSTSGPANTGGAVRLASRFSTPSTIGNTSFQTPYVSNIKGNVSLKPFKSPLLNRSAMKTPGNRQTRLSLLNPTPTPAWENRPAASGSSAFTAVAPTSDARLTTTMPNRSTPTRKTPARKFVTPFKSGMRPGEPGRAQLKARYDAEGVNASLGPSTDGVPSTNHLTRRPTRRRFFDLTAPDDRKTLTSSGLRPGTHSLEGLVSMGINVAELSNLSPRSAIQRGFRFSSGLGPQRPSDALRELQAAGCTLATQEWVNNHWSLILWKLAGMAALDSESEVDDNKRRWSWKEVMRQLLYRYEKELNGGARPALRLITTRDTSAGLHMVLCVSDITWSHDGVKFGVDGLPVIPHPTLELTDGWYRLRTKVDEILARAVRRGVIRVGRKISISGATIPRDIEPCEVLEAYDRVELTITGNSTHLAPWHAKLGFQSYPAIATLNSLSPDGGMIPCLELIVTKLYPIAFIEFHKGEDGKVTREGPRREKDELAVHDAWARKREREYQRLRKETDDKSRQYLDWALRFEAKSGSWHSGEEEDMPGHIESMFDECEYSSDVSLVLRRASKAEAGWLARFTRDRVEKEREMLDLELERELQAACPPREVRNFRVLLMRDARVVRRPALRVVELTVWDVLSLSFNDAAVGHFKEGQRFQITNLLPTQKSAWMDRHAEGSHVYVSSSKTSRWTKLWERALQVMEER